MLKLILMLIIIMGQASCAVQPEIPDSEMNFVHTIEIPGYKKDQLYIKTRTWMASVFVSSEAVLEYEDKEAGMLAGKGIGQHSPVTFLSPAGFENFDYNLRIEVKDEKVRLSMINLRLIFPIDSAAHAFRTKRLSMNERKGAHEYGARLAKSLSDELKHPTLSENW